MAFKDLLDLTKKQFLKKNPDADVEFRAASEEPAPTGLIVDNPLFEYLLDRRFLAYGRFVLVYGKKGSSKTSLFLDLAKLYQRVGGDVIWIETEHAIDLDYVKKQGVDLSKIAVIHPDSLEQGLGIAETIIRNMPKAYPDGDTPVLIAFDSIAGAAVEYELDQSNTISDIQPGIHARLLSRFFRELEKPLANEKAVFLMLNQLKSKIGGMGYGEDAHDALIGGEAQFFHSSIHLKMAKIQEMTAPGGEDGATRKIGSVHKLQCKRNKLGREGKHQEVEIDLYIDGGIDWWSPLVRKLAKEYTSLVTRAGAYYKWNIPNTSYIDPETKKLAVIDTEKSFREAELAMVIRASTAAKDEIRKVFGIPALPAAKEVEEIESTRKKKRKAALKTDDPAPITRTVSLVEGA